MLLREWLGNLANVSNEDRIQALFTHCGCLTTNIVVPGQRFACRRKCCTNISNLSKQFQRCCYSWSWYLPTHLPFVQHINEIQWINGGPDPHIYHRLAAGTQTSPKDFETMMWVTRGLGIGHDAYFTNIVWRCHDIESRHWHAECQQCTRLSKHTDVPDHGVICHRRTGGITSNRIRLFPELARLSCTYLPSISCATPSTLSTIAKQWLARYSHDDSPHGHKFA